MRPLGVTVLASVDAVQREVACFAVLSDAADAVVVRHDLREHDGRFALRRVVSDREGVVEDVVVELEHPCLSCALREDLLPTLVRLQASGRWSEALLALPVGGEPHPVVRALLLPPDASTTRRLPLRAAVTAVDASSLVDDLFGDDLLAERGQEHGPDDRRAVGEVLAHQMQQSDLLLLDDEDDEPLAQPLLAHLLPRTTPVLAGGAATPGAQVLVPRADRDRSLRAGDPRTWEPSGAADHGPVWTLDLDTWKPLHPDRLHAEIEALATGRSRSRGRFWLPGRPGTVVGWDGSGGQLSIGDVGGWDAHERGTRLVVTGIGGDLREQVAEAFARVVVTDRELARGRDWWLARDDGFDAWLGERRVA